MKGQILPGHIGVNHYELTVLGLIPIVFTKISVIGSETTWVQLPDRTQASGGETVPGEFTATLPMHHTAERLLLDAWMQEGRDPVLPTYKKVATVQAKDIHGKVAASYSLVGLAVSKRDLPDFEMANDGEMAEATYTFKYDDVLPL